MSAEESKRLFSRKDAGAYLDKSLREIDRLIASGPVRGPASHD